MDHPCSAARTSGSPKVQADTYLGLSGKYLSPGERRRFQHRLLLRISDCLSDVLLSVLALVGPILGHQLSHWGRAIVP